jgi:hypothetical protein
MITALQQIELTVSLINIALAVRGMKKPQRLNTGSYIHLGNRSTRSKSEIFQ